MSTNENNRLRQVASILISQPVPPAHSPYFSIEKKHNIKIDFREFLQVEDLPAKEFRKQRINPAEFPCIIFTSRNAVNNYFRLCEELRSKPSQETKYFCLSENIANYLQKFIVYRKRKVFFGARSITDLKDSLMKYRKKERFLLPCSNLGSKEVVHFLTEHEFVFTESVMYHTIPADLSDLKDIFYDILVFFSPLDIQSLFDNFPDFKQNNTRIAVFGDTTAEATLSRNLIIDIKAPTPDCPSMPMAIEKYILEANKSEQSDV